MLPAIALCVLVAVLPLLPLLPRGAAASACSPDELAVYRVFLDTHWSRDAFPKQYPEWRPPAGWSKVVGRTHDASYWLFREGELASAGLQAFAEKGHSDSLEAAEHAGVYDEFTAPAVPRGVGRTVADFFLDGNHSLVSVAVRVVPSPDWFIGVDSLDLCRGNHWIDSIAIDVDPMDAGTDNGFTFTAPNWPSEPKEPVARITSKRPNHPANSFYYPKLDKLPSIATLTFVKCRATSGGTSGGACASRNATDTSAPPQPLAATTSGQPPPDLITSTPPKSTFLTTIPPTHAASARSKPPTTTPSQLPTTTPIKPSTITPSQLPTTTTTKPSTTTPTQPPTTNPSQLPTTIPTKPSTTTTTQPPTTTPTTAPITSSTPTIDPNPQSTAPARVVREVAAAAASLSTPQAAPGAVHTPELPSTTAPSQPVGTTPGSTGSPASSVASLMAEASTSTAAVSAVSTVSTVPPDQPASTATAPTTPAYAPSERAASRCPAECARQIPANTPTFAQTEVDDIDDLMEERVYHLSMELSRNASVGRDAVVDGNDISNDLSPGLGGVGGVGGGFDSTESAVRRTSKARRSKKGSRQAKNCQVSEWSAWSACSVSCGVGDATRTRRVIEHPRRGGQPCPALQERRWCGGHSECPQNFFNW